MIANNPMIDSMANILTARINAFLPQPCFLSVLNSAWTETSIF